MSILKNTIKLALMVLIILLILALFWSLYSYGVLLGILSSNENQNLFLIGVPIIFISFPLGIFNAIREKEVKTKYGIRFWGAVKNIPDYFVLITYILFLVVLMSSLLKNDDFIMFSIIIILYYESLLFLCSSLLEKKKML